MKCGTQPGGVATAAAPTATHSGNPRGSASRRPAAPTPRQTHRLPQLLCHEIAASQHKVQR